MLDVSKLVDISYQGRDGVHLRLRVWPARFEADVAYILSTETGDALAAGYWHPDTSLSVDGSANVSMLLYHISDTFRTMWYRDDIREWASDIALDGPEFFDPLPSDE